MGIVSASSSCRNLRQWMVGWTPTPLWPTGPMQTCGGLCWEVRVASLPPVSAAEADDSLTPVFLLNCVKEQSGGMRRVTAPTTRAACPDGNLACRLSPPSSCSLPRPNYLWLPLFTAGISLFPPALIKALQHLLCSLQRRLSWAWCRLLCRGGQGVSGPGNMFFPTLVQVGGELQLYGGDDQECPGAAGAPAGLEVRGRL